MSDLFDRYVQNVTRAGYEEDFDEIISLVDRGDYVHIIAPSHESADDCMVTRWYWDRDYGGTYDFEGTLEQCCRFLLHFGHNATFAKSH